MYRYRPLESGKASLAAGVDLPMLDRCTMAGGA
jgi:hypothetical protein